MDRLVHARLDSDLARPLREGLSHEYAVRYADYTFTGPGERPPKEMDMFPPVCFQPPYGDLLLLIRDGEAIAGGAYMYCTKHTAEIKRMWTSPNHRRQGLARRMIAELEHAIVQRGYSQVILGTGARQPEAIAMYLNLEFEPLFDVTADPEEIQDLWYFKRLREDLGPGVSPQNMGQLLRAGLQKRIKQRTEKWRPTPEVAFQLPE